MTAVATATRTPLAGRRSPQFRFGAVFALVLTLVLFEVLAPSDDWARAGAVALAGGALTVAVATSRARAPVRRARAWLVGGFALARWWSGSRPEVIVAVRSRSRW